MGKEQQENTRDIGQSAEDAAVVFLKRRGFRIIDRNVRYRFGEIDIIGWDGEVLCFVEVRSRKNDSFGTPEATIGQRKQARISKAAAAYLQKRFSKWPPCRFDAVALLGSGKSKKITFIEGAFDFFFANSNRSNPWQVS